LLEGERVAILTILQHGLFFLLRFRDSAYRSRLDGSLSLLSAWWKKNTSAGSAQLPSLVMVIASAPAVQMLFPAAFIPKR
jgi:hypothetical protein